MIAEAWDGSLFGSLDGERWMRLDVIKTDAAWPPDGLREAKTVEGVSRDNVLAVIWGKYTGTNSHST